MTKIINKDATACNFQIQTLAAKYDREDALLAISLAHEMKLHDICANAAEFEKRLQAWYAEAVERVRKIYAMEAEAAEEDED